MEKQLPKNWIECTMNELAEITAGIGFPNHLQGNLNGEIPFYKVGDISQSILRNEIYLNNANNYISEEVRKELKGKLFPKGTLVFAKIGEALRLNRRAIISKPSLCDNNVMGIIPNHMEMYKLIYYYFCTLDLGDFSAGNSIPSIRKSSVLGIPFPLPPLAEQNRLVTKLDKLFTQLETIKISMANIPLLLKDFRQQVLTQAVTGKLTEEWRKGKGLKEWEYKKIENITLKVGSGSTPTGGQAAYLDEGIPLIRSMNVHFNGIKFDGIAYLSEHQAKGLKNVEVFEDDILLNITGASIGRVCLAPKEINGARVNQHVCIIRVNNELKPSFLNIYLSSPVIQNLINNENYGVTRQSFTKAQILALNIPIPHIEEQQIILSKVESLFIKADAIEKQYKFFKLKIDKLPQVLLHKAFKGELTEQLDSDGDARELLKQIQELKNSGVKPKKGIAKKVKNYPEKKEVLGMVAEEKK